MRENQDEMNDPMTAMKKQETIVLVSGGFDPLHVGHIRLFQAARSLGTQLWVLVHQDDWLLRKKGFVFMPFLERMAIIRAIKGVSDVRGADSQEDGAVDQTLIRIAREIRHVNPSVHLIFANGGDRLTLPEPEERTCHALEITMTFNVGGKKVQSSSVLVQQAREAYGTPLPK